MKLPPPNESFVRVLERPTRVVRDALFVASIFAVVIYVFYWVIVPIRERDRVLDTRLRETSRSIRQLEKWNRTLYAEARSLVEDPDYVEYLLRREARYTRRDKSMRRKR